MVITQIPSNLQPNSAATLLDARYPLGTRVAIATGPAEQNLRVLSGSLAAAGEPVVSYDGRRVVFAGKKSSTSEWQIYENEVRAAGRPRALTALPGGAMDPALLGDGTLLYVSPVPNASGERGSGQIPSLFALNAGGTARQLTFGLPVSEPTVLADGRILFVSPGPNRSSSGSALYTINNDGTEISAYAGQHDLPALPRRSRELPDGRIVFLAGKDQSSLEGKAEYVLSARPFDSRAPLLSNSPLGIYSVEAAANGGWLVCARTERAKGAVFQVNPSAASLQRPALENQGWADVEATLVAARQRPMGRLSSIDLAHDSGQILCLNVNDTTVRRQTDSPPSMARRVRIFIKGPADGENLLGEVEAQADGSFMAEVPANLALGFETVDEHGRVLAREPPLMWVRPGENRSCVGCHEQHNHSPRNARPLAVRVPVPRLTATPAKLARTFP